MPWVGTQSVPQRNLRPNSGIGTKGQIPQRCDPLFFRHRCRHITRCFRILNHRVRLWLAGTSAAHSLMRSAPAGTSIRRAHGGMALADLLAAHSACFIPSIGCLGFWLEPACEEGRKEGLTGPRPRPLALSHFGTCSRAGTARLGPIANTIAKQFSPPPEFPAAVPSSGPRAAPRARGFRFQPIDSCKYLPARWLRVPLVTQEEALALSALILKRFCSP